MSTTAPPGAAQAAAVRVEAALVAVRSAVSAAGSGEPAETFAGLDEDGWLRLLDLTRQVESAIAAVQTIALARVAAVDDEVREDGTVETVVRGLGHVREDAGDLVAGALGCTPGLAATKTHRAARIARDLPRVVAWMCEGMVGDYGARVLVDTVDGLDGPACASVLDRIEPWLSERPGTSPGQLRAKVRSVVAVVAADQVKTVLEQVSGDRTLSRSHDRLGGQTWSAVLPNGDADLAWDAVDELARRYLREGVADTLEQARADALIDLVNAHVDTTVVITVAVPTSPDLALDSRASDRPATPAGADPVEPAGADPAPPALGPSAFAHVSGLVTSGPVEVASTWWDGLTGETPCHTDEPAAIRLAPLRRIRTLEVACDPDTGLLSGAPSGNAGHDASAALRRFVLTRDGGCRFPDCTVTPPRCDLDHVRPWPQGRTEAGNLVALCRHHHRVKQRHRWSLVLHDDGTATWTTPDGRHLVTTPVDHRAFVAEPAHAAGAGAGLGSVTVASADPSSVLESHLIPLLRSAIRTTRRTDIALARAHRGELPLADRWGHRAMGLDPADLRALRQATVLRPDRHTATESDPHAPRRARRPSRPSRTHEAGPPPF